MAREDSLKFDGQRVLAAWIATRSNLILSGFVGMVAITDCSREVEVRSQRVELRGAPAVHVAVGDAGPGWTADEGKRLFQPFYTTKPRGLGMGLSIGRSIVEAHGGPLTGALNAGHGATFRFTPPAGSGGGP
jgi:C4-dicarboxylate-specific signal transduction histidine kinase